MHEFWCTHFCDSAPLTEISETFMEHCRDIIFIGTNETNKSRPTASFSQYKCLRKMFWHNICSYRI